MTIVDELVCLLDHASQKQTHRSTRQSPKSGLIQPSIIHRDFGLKCLSFSNTPVAYYC